MDRCDYARENGHAQVAMYLMDPSAPRIAPVSPIKPSAPEAPTLEA